MASRTDTDYKALLTAIYLRANPAKVREIDGILLAYSGREDELLRDVTLKYDVAVAGSMGAGAGAGAGAGSPTSASPAVIDEAALASQIRATEQELAAEKKGRRSRSRRPSGAGGSRSGGGKTLSLWSKMKGGGGVDGFTPNAALILLNHQHQYRNPPPQPPPPDPQQQQKQQAVLRRTVALLREEHEEEKTLLRRELERATTDGLGLRAAADAVREAKAARIGQLVDEQARMRERLAVARSRAAALRAERQMQNDVLCGKVSGSECSAGRREGGGGSVRPAGRRVSHPQ